MFKIMSGRKSWLTVKRMSGRRSKRRNVRLKLHVIRKPQLLPLLKEAIMEQSSLVHLTVMVLVEI